MNYYFKGEMIVDLSNNIPYIHAKNLKSEQKNDDDVLNKQRNFNF